MIRIRPGDIAADGVIETGQASINQANIHESPCGQKVASEGFAGTQNLTELEVKVTRADADTTLMRTI